MWIDIALLIIVIIGIIRGFQHGFIISVFVTAAWILGILGALKFCSVAAVALRDRLHVDSPYTPVIAFILLFILIAIVIYWMGKSLEKVMEVAQLGLINKVLGILLRVGIYFFVFSLFLWLLNQGGLLSPESKTESKTYHTLDIAANSAIDFLEERMPVIKSIFHDVEKFFEDLSHRAGKIV